MKYRGIIFDLDGTLLDTLGDILTAVNGMQERLGYRQASYDELKTMIGDGARRMVERAIGSQEPKKVLPALDLYNEIYAHTTGKTRAFEGIEDLLAYCAQNEIKTAVLSNKPDRDAQAICKRILSHSFQKVIGQSDAFPVKPDTKGLLAIVDCFGFGIERCLYVGDGEMDYITPSRVGMRTLSALWGYRSKEQLQKVGAKEFIGAPREVLDYLKS